MPNTVGYNPMQQPNPYNYHHHHRHHHHHHQEAHQLSPISQIRTVSSYSNHRLNNTNKNNNNNNKHHHQTPTPTPAQILTQSSAYFLDRIDLENYTTYTLQQTVENILAKTKSKGLKVKISLPDDGLIIDNITDPDQSWIFKTPELLYFWRDPYYVNLIVIVTINRSRHHSNRPYSASIFRLRGTDSTNSFIQRAQQFFAKLSSSVSTSSISKNNKNALIAKPIRTETRSTDRNHSSNNKSKRLSTINEQLSSTTSINHRRRSPQTSTPIRLVTRAEFEPGKTTATDSIGNLYNRRTYSETASSNDSQTNSIKEILSYTKKSKNDNYDDDDKMTIISSNLSGENVAELMRELKELRNEIAALKLEKRITPVTRSMSTSPLAVYPEKSKHNIESSTTGSSSPSFPDVTSQSEVDAETQTDFSLINHRRRQLSRKNKKTMVGSGGISSLIKKNRPPSNTRSTRRTFSSSSTNTVSDQEALTQEHSSHVNESSNDTNLLLNQGQYHHPTVLAAPPRPVLQRNQNDSMALKSSTLYTMSTDGQMLSNEEGPFLHGTPVAVEKEMSKFLSTNIPSSSDVIGSTVPILTGGTATFRSSSDNSNAPTEHIYENVPILIHSNSNRESYYHIPIINGDDQQAQQEQQQQQTQSDGYLYYTIVGNRGTESQQQNGVSYNIPEQTALNSSVPTENNSSTIQSSAIQQQKPQIISMGRHRSQPVYFANHLTNPMFNGDKQLLTNTIANQFGVDLNSPQLQQLLTNQHLFAARKRTFANMVWQLTPDEETALSSSPITTTTQRTIIDINTIDSNNSTARSILKATKRLRSTSKRRGIKWDSALE